MDPALSFAMIRSRIGAVALLRARSKVSRASLAVWSFWLWHVTQYVFRKTRGSAGGVAAHRVKNGGTNARMNARKVHDGAFQLEATGVVIRCYRTGESIY